MNWTASIRLMFERGWKYTLVGLICALSNYTIMLLNDAAGEHYLLGTIIAFVLVTPLAYLLHSRFTFAEPLGTKAFVRFVIAAASAYPVAAAILVFLCSGLHLSVAVAYPILTVSTFCLNFATAHWSILRGLRLPVAALEPPFAGDKQ